MQYHHFSCSIALQFDIVVYGDSPVGLDLVVLFFGETFEEKLPHTLKGFGYFRGEHGIRELKLKEANVGTVPIIVFQIQAQLAFIDIEFGQQLEFFRIIYGLFLFLLCLLFLPCFFV